MDVVEIVDKLFGLLKPWQGLTKTWSAAVKVSARLVEKERERWNVVLDSEFPELSLLERRVVVSSAEMAASIDSVRDPFPLDEVALRMAAVVQLAKRLEPFAAEKKIGIQRQSAGIVLKLAPSDKKPFNSVSKVFRRDLLWNRVMKVPILKVRAAESKEGDREPCSREAAAETCLSSLLQRHLDNFDSLTYGVALFQDVEFVHEIRVALRRFRSIIKAFRKLLPESMSAMRDRSKNLASVLGQVRDEDVFIEFLTKYQDSEGASAFTEGLIRSAKRMRRIARRNLVTAFESGDAGDLLLGAEPVLEEAIRLTSGKTICDVGKKLLRKRLKKVKRYEKPLKKYDSSQRHKLRIQFKRLRYIGEPLEEICPNKAFKPLVKMAEKMQDLLGLDHDYQVFEDRVKKFRTRRERRKHNSDDAKASDALLVFLEEGRSKALKKSEALWSEFLKQKYDKQLKT